MTSFRERTSSPHMRVIAKKILRVFWENHPDAEGPLQAWHHELVKANWKNWTEMKRRFPSADAVGGDRYVFNIKGNTYRLVAEIAFAFGIVFVKFIGTHAEYDRITAREVEPK